MFFAQGSLPEPARATKRTRGPARKSPGFPLWGYSPRRGGARGPGGHAAGYRLLRPPPTPARYAVMSDSSWPLSVGNVTDRRLASFSMIGPWFHMAVN